MDPFDGDAVMRDGSDDDEFPQTSTKSLVQASSPPLFNSSLDPSRHFTVRQDAPRPPKFASLPRSTLQTGLVYDVRMRFHVEPFPKPDDLHPEDPRRIHVIYEALVQHGLVWSGKLSGPSDFYMARIDARKVTPEEVYRVHTRAHHAWVESLSTKSSEDLVDYVQHPGIDSIDSVYLSPSTPYCASLSAGGAIEACRAVVLGRVKNVFAVIRPPGHHAEREDVKGFCFYDNVSIALKACQIEFGDRCRKVFVLDWDVHHGNGIQQANYKDPNVLYVSLHVHLGGKFYPERSYRDNRVGYGDHLHCGEGAGLGKNVNIPWRVSGMGDADYLYAFQQVVIPIATEFDPDLVIIAAGFDAADGDMLGNCHVTPAGYAHMTHMLMSLAKGKVAVCLEGGYNLESISRSSVAVARTLMGEPPDRLENFTPTQTGVDDVLMVKRQQSKYWSSLYPQSVDALLPPAAQGDRGHDLVRQWQAYTYFADFKMMPLPILRHGLSKSFRNQVIVTKNYEQARPVLILLHDPPTMLASPDPRTGVVELHNTWLTDHIKSYVDWAVKHGFSVFDVNLPKHITADNSRASRQHEETDDVESRAKEASDLLTYLWDNYIELSDATHIFVMGTNVGHLAITDFIKNNDQRAADRINLAISFVEDVSFQGVRATTYENLPNWYYTHSLVFVAEAHYWWSNEMSTKRKKRFGRIAKSPKENMREMLAEHQQTVIQAMEEETRSWRAANPDLMQVDEEKEEVVVVDDDVPPSDKHLATGFHQAGSSGGGGPAGSASPFIRSPTKAANY